MNDNERPFPSAVFDRRHLPVPKANKPDYAKMLAETMLEKFFAVKHKPIQIRIRKG